MRYLVPAPALYFEKTVDPGTIVFSQKHLTDVGGLLDQKAVKEQTETIHCSLAEKTRSRIRQAHPCEVDMQLLSQGGVTLKLSEAGARLP